MSARVRPLPVSHWRVAQLHRVGQTMRRTWVTKVESGATPGVTTIGCRTWNLTRSNSSHVWWRWAPIPPLLLQRINWKTACSKEYGQIWNSALTSWARYSGSGARLVPSDAEYVRMRNEHHVTLRVLAVVVEQLLAKTGSDMLELSDQVVLNAPDLIAGRDEQRGVIELEVRR